MWRGRSRVGEICSLAQMIKQLSSDCQVVVNKLHLISKDICIWEIRSLAQMVKQLSSDFQKITSHQRIISLYGPVRASIHLHACMLVGAKQNCAAGGPWENLKTKIRRCVLTREFKDSHQNDTLCNISHYYWLRPPPPPHNL